jgi:fructokinase
MKPVGAIEAGGTKFVCAVGTGPDDLETVRIETRAPEETLRDVIGFFAGRKLRRIGLGCFGPLDLQRGVITTTPKLDWRGVPIRAIIENALDARVTIDTDVNAAALAEHRWGAAQGIANFVYLTVGTGIGGGAMVNGRLLHGLAHPEMGHVCIPGQGRGVCPSHEDCLEGYASGPAVHTLGNGDTARHLANGLRNISAVLSPELIILGGGVMKTPGLLAAIRTDLKRETYLKLPRLTRPKLKDRAGVLGALLLAQMKL